MEYIVDTTPLVINDINHELLKSIELKISNNESLLPEEATYFLDYLVYATRCKVVKNFNETFEYKCDLAQSIMTYYLKSINANTMPNATQTSIAPQIEGHNFNIVKLKVDEEDKYFIVDPTYRQFFLKDNCNDNKFFIHNGIILISAHPGYFIKPEDYQIIENFLHHGYMEMNEHNTKVYGDSFYQTKIGIKEGTSNSYTLPGSSYMNLFSKGNIALSKSEKELRESDLLIEPLNKELTKSTHKGV